MSDATPPGNANDYGATLPPPGVTGGGVSVGGANPGATGDEVIHAGKKIGKYLIRRLIGRGGMGAVYEAMDIPLQRKVALKILPHAFSHNEEALKRFIREAQLAARLNHPNVVGVFDVGRKGSIYFIAMELVQGTSGQEILESGTKMDWREATRAIADVCRALASAHEAGLIHRDIKPGNILWSQSGAVKLSDFGLAKPTQTPQDLSITRRDAFVGTPLYMSPEQCRNDGIDHRSDIYSLGATFYTFLTGRAPYSQGSAIQILFAHCSAPIPDVRDSIPDVPQLCTYIVQKAMAKAPEDRYQSAHDMRRDLEALLGGETDAMTDLSTLAVPQPAAAVLEYSPPRPSRNKPVIFAVLGIVIATVLLIALVPFMLMRSAAPVAVATPVPAPAVPVAPAVPAPVAVVPPPVQQVVPSPAPESPAPDVAPAAPVIEREPLAPEGLVPPASLLENLLPDPPSEPANDASPERASEPTPDSSIERPEPPQRPAPRGPQSPETVTSLNDDETAAGFTPVAIRDPAVRHYLTARRLANEVLAEDDPVRRQEAARMMVAWFDFMRNAPNPLHKRAAVDARKLAEILERGIVTKMPRTKVTDPSFPTPPEANGPREGPDREGRDRNDRPGPPQRRQNRN